MITGVDTTNVAAWRCENCLKLIPAHVDPTALLVLEIAVDDEIISPNVWGHEFAKRRMVVCEVCRFDIMGVDDDLGGS